MYRPGRTFFRVQLPVAFEMAPDIILVESVLQSSTEQLCRASPASESSTRPDMVNGEGCAGRVFCAEPVMQNNQKKRGSMRRARGMDMRRKDAIYDGSMFLYELITTLYDIFSTKRFNL